MPLPICRACREIPRRSGHSHLPLYRQRRHRTQDPLIVWGVKLHRDGDGAAQGRDSSLRRESVPLSPHDRESEGKLEKTPPDGRWDIDSLIGQCCGTLPRITSLLFCQPRIGFLQPTGHADTQNLRPILVLEEGLVPPRTVAVDSQCLCNPQTGKPVILRRDRSSSPRAFLEWG